MNCMATESTTEYLATLRAYEKYIVYPRQQTSELRLWSEVAKINHS